MKCSILLFLVFISSIGHSQLVHSNTTKINSSLTSKSYVIGIGNSESTIYDNALKYLESDPAIKVYAICSSHQIIGFKVLHNEYKSYDVIRDLLRNEYEDLILLRKDDSIFSKECNDEILKQ